MPFRIAATKPKSSPHLDADAWIEAALDALAENGVESVRVERLAKTLQVTKGSFYWHFKDRPALLEAMLHSWRQRATLGIIDRLERGNVPALDRLKQLLALPRASGRSARGADIEAAIRLWARQDAKAASAIAEIDHLRTEHIRALLVATGQFAADLAPARAMLLYAYMQGLAAIAAYTDASLFADCEDLLLQP